MLKNDKSMVIDEPPMNYSIKKKRGVGNKILSQILKMLLV
jgi:hypothetical protein